MNTEWISVVDRLPEYEVHAGGTRFVHVIVNVQGIVGSGLFLEGTWYFLGVKTRLITHWMPFPEPPPVE